MRALVLAVSFAAILGAQEPGAQTTGAQDAAPKVDFHAQIAPLLVQRCIECHGPDKDKGDLRLDTRAFALPDDDSTIVRGKPDESEFIHRIELPAGDEDIMPAKGEPLTAAQQALLRRWVAEGAEWPADGDAKIAELIAARTIPKLTFELPALEAGEDAAIEAAITALRARGAVVQRVAADTEAIDVNLSLQREKIRDADVRLLLPLGKRLVWLDLSRTALTDEGAAQLARLTELRRLVVANTKLSDAAFPGLAALARLEVVNAYGTGLGDAGLRALAQAPALRRVYAWQTQVTKAAAEALRAANGRLEIDLGDYAETRLAAARQEIAEREAKQAAEKTARQDAPAKDAPVNDACPVSGAAIDAGVTVLFEGRRVAFCCEKCKAKFEKDPKAFAGKLPK